MSLSRSLTSGASSLQGHQRKFDVISNNIANVNTTGFKSSRLNFADQLSQLQTHGSAPGGENSIGGVNPIQYGLGVKVGSVQKNMQAGPIETTDRPLDVALQGQGFFVYNVNGRELYSRAGTLTRDTEGNMVDSSSGAYLQGYNLETDADGRVIKDADGINTLNSKYTNLQIPPNIVSAPRQSQIISLAGNLNSASAEGTERNTSINVFDNNGGTRSINLTFTKTANPNEYTLGATIDGLALNISDTAITFNNDGTLNTPMSITATAADLNTALGATLFDDGTPKDLTISLATEGNLLGGLTQFGGPNTATIIEQDGWQSGELLSLSVNQEGKVLGSFTNGQTEVLGQMILAKFANPEGMVKEGSNFFSVAPDSGLAQIGTANQVFKSSNVIGSALEGSNVDLTTEFVDMITTQRAYDAASRTIMTSDQMLQQLSMLKR